jgi:hypothetical protein
MEQRRREVPSPKHHDLREKRMELHSHRRKLHDRLTEVCEDFVTRAFPAAELAVQGNGSRVRCLSPRFPTNRSRHRSGRAGRWCEADDRGNEIAR